MKISDDEMVAVSPFFTEHKRQVVGVYHFRELGLFFMTFYEDEDDEAIYLHYKHVIEQDASLENAAGEPGSISLRKGGTDGKQTEWRRYEGYSDEEIMNILDSGEIDELYQSINAELDE
ncbi:hypothetical protein V5R04_07285 [Jonesiaceae bacterium BS-20]|uniref:Uncharacterized protein n=1 Tax=Jonesiaceae bacterium BS-20 TaxID=3120821 RepID=A0AAU7DZP9_9MICO